MSKLNSSLKTISNNAKLIFGCWKDMNSISNEMIGLEVVDIFLRANEISQPTITCSKLTKEKLEQGVKYVQS